MKEEEKLFIWRRKNVWSKNFDWKIDIEDNEYEKNILIIYYVHRMFLQAGAELGKNKFVPKQNFIC